MKKEICGTFHAKCGTRDLTYVFGTVPRKAGRVVTVVCICVCMYARMYVCVCMHVCFYHNTFICRALKFMNIVLEFYKISYETPLLNLGQ
jgi:hypothetical protein